MAKEKKYRGDFKEYEKKLRRVMERFGVDKFHYDWSRSECFIEFTYRGQFYQFEHSLDKAAAHKQGINCVSDLFAQIVMSLEDIARMSERGIYELSTWIEGMKALPPQKKIPNCFIKLGFDNIPTMDELKVKYRELAKVSHPDKGGSATLFNMYANAYQEAERYLTEASLLTAH